MQRAEELALSLPEGGGRRLSAALGSWEPWSQLGLLYIGRAGEGEGEPS